MSGFLTFATKRDADTYEAKISAFMGFPNAHGTARYAEPIELKDGTWALPAEPYVIAKIDADVAKGDTTQTRAKIVPTVEVKPTAEPTKEPAAEAKTTVK